MELRPDLVPTATAPLGKSGTSSKTLAGAHGASGDAGDPADIVWTNRGTATAAGAGDTDLFGARFGASAPAARAVVDAVIVAYERMIGSFNYAAAGTTFSLNVSMGAANGGFGASASLTTQLGGKPKGGNITMGAGSGTTGGNGWFIDPTPYESSEFLGAIVNEFSGNAQSGSPAAGRSDFYTVVAAELTHCIGLFGNTVAGWAARTSATTIVDSGEGGGVGKLWTFNGPSIQHLLTSNNAGSGGSDFNAAIHSSGPNTVTVGGVSYSGAQDQGNAIYEQGRRYLVNNVFALMFKDAYNYASVDPAAYGTFYSTINSTTKALTVRGGATTSADNISVSRTGNTLAVSVDVGTDIAGTGALPGAGNLPAFVSYYDVSEVSTIIIQAGDGTDSINVNDLPAGISLNIDAGAGNDTINLGSTNLDALSGPITVTGGSGADTLYLNDATSLADNNYDFTGSLVTRAGNGGVVYGTIESLRLNASAGNNIINLNSSPAGTAITLNATAGNDVFNIANGDLGAIGGSVTILGGGTGKVVIFDQGARTSTYTLDSGTLGRTGFSALNYSFVQSVELYAEDGANTIDINGTAAGTLLKLHANDGTDTINVNATNATGPLSIFGSNGTDVVNVNADNAGVARATFAGSQAIGSLNIGDGGFATTEDGGAVTLVTNTLAISSAGTLDLKDDAMVVDYTGTSPVDAIRSALTAGYAGGAWAGNGIASSVAAVTAGRSIGYAEASDLFSSFPATFAGTTVDNTAVVLKFTLAADTDLNDTVDFADLVRLAQNYNLTGQTFGRGDFDFDGTVSFSDLVILAQLYGQSLNPGTAAASLTGGSTISLKADNLASRKGKKVTAGRISLLA